MFSGDLSEELQEYFTGITLPFLLIRTDLEGKSYYYDSKELGRAEG